MAARCDYRYWVERDVWGPARAEISLVRSTPDHGALRLVHRHRPEAVVLLSRTFRPRAELDELERYAAELERVAEHANSGTLGYFVDKRSTEGTVEIALYERWFDGSHLRCEQLARRLFDPTDDQALVASAEFVAELEDWAERRNHDRELDDLQKRVEQTDMQERASEKTAAAAELAAILNQHQTPI